MKLFLKKYIISLLILISFFVILLFSIAVFVTFIVMIFRNVDETLQSSSGISIFAIFLISFVFVLLLGLLIYKKRYVDIYIAYRIYVLKYKSCNKFYRNSNTWKVVINQWDKFLMENNYDVEKLYFVFLHH